MTMPVSNRIYNYCHAHGVAISMDRAVQLRLHFGFNEVHDEDIQIELKELIIGFKRNGSFAVLKPIKQPEPEPIKLTFIQELALRNESNYQVRNK